MFNKRPDGRRIRNIEPMQLITSYLMKPRYDAMNMYEDVFPCEVWDSYIKEKAAEGLPLSYMHIFIAGIVRLFAMKPRLNRFVMHGKVYARPKVWVSFVVHPTLHEGSEGTTIKLAFEGTESIIEIAEKLNTAITNETTKRVSENGTDKLARVLTSIPSPILHFVVNTLMWMDKHNILPRKIIELSPFHTSFFLTNLKSLGINYLHHHTYEFGTTGLFFSMGKEKVVPVYKKDSFVPEKQMPFSLVCDERFCDGLYFALALRELRKILRNPKVLETPLDKKVEDTY